MAAPQTPYTTIATPRRPVSIAQITTQTRSISNIVSGSRLDLYSGKDRVGGFGPGLSGILIDVVDPCGSLYLQADNGVIVNTDIVPNDFCGNNNLGTASLRWGNLFTDFQIFINDSSNGDQNNGLTIKQNSCDSDQALGIKHNDVAHGITDVAETDTYFGLWPVGSSVGGASLSGFTDSVIAMILKGWVNTENTVKSVLAAGAVEVEGYTRSGTSATAMGCDANIFVVQNAGAAKFLVDAEGDVHYDATTNANAWDDYPDWQLARALRASMGLYAPELLDKYKDVLAATRIVTYNPDGHHFISTKRLHAFILDAIFQLGSEVYKQSWTSRQCVQLSNTASAWVRGVSSVATSLIGRLRKLLI